MNALNHRPSPDKPSAWTTEQPLVGAFFTPPVLRSWDESTGHETLDALGCAVFESCTVAVVYVVDLSASTCGDVLTQIKWQLIHRIEALGDQEFPNTKGEAPVFQVVDSDFEVGFGPLQPVFELWIRLVRGAARR